MSPPRRLQWQLPERPPPKHPYRDTLIVYAGLAVVIVLIAWATGGKVGKAAVVAAVVFVVASAWSIVRWRAKLQAEARRAENGSREP
jgi:hypothetical protein